MLRACSVILLSLLVGCSRDPAQDSAAPPDPKGPAVRELIFNTYLPPQDTVRKAAVEDFAKRIEAAGKGTLKIVIPDAALGTSSNQWSIVTEGVADLAVVAVFSHRAQLRLPLIADLPLNCLSAEAASVALWNTQRKYFDQANEFADAKLLSMYVLPPFQYIGRREPIRSIEDFRGQKIWVSAGAPTEAVKLLGGVPVSSLYSQLFEYASKGNVDALMIGPGTVKQAGIGNHVRYMTEMPGGMGSVSFAIVMNKETYAALSAEQREAVERAAEGLPQHVGRALDERNRQGLAETRLTLNTASPALMGQLRARLRKLHDEWLETARQRGLANAAEVLQYYRAEMERVASHTEPSPMSETGAAQ